MTQEPETPLRFSVWRPARLDGTYLHVTGEANGPIHSALLDGSAVLEQIYAWDPGPHDFASSSSSAAVQRITERLLRPFGEHRPPAERQVGRFLEAVNELLDESEVQAGTHWSDCEDTVTAGDTELNLRVNAAVGVLTHFLWIARVFADVPAASVLIR